MRSIFAIALPSLLAVLLGAACHGKPPSAPPPGSAPAAPAFAANGRANGSADPREEKGLLSLYDDELAHPFNRVHRALFRSEEQVSRAPCLLKTPRDCAKQKSAVGDLGGIKPGPGEYAEAPTLFASTDVRKLAEAPRFGEAMAALRDALRVAPGKNPIAAALLQHDLWERFDTLDAALRTQNADGEPLPSSPTASEPLRLLRDQIGALMRRLALPTAVIAKLPGNLGALSHAHPDLLGGIADDDGKWLEVATRSRSLPQPMQSPFREGTRHAMMAGYRAAFRRFVRISDGDNQGSGAEWLRHALAEHPATLKLPPGALAVIMQIPFVVSAEAEIVPLPLVNLIEVRRVSAPPAEPEIDLTHLGFEVLDGWRALLRKPGDPSGGLVRLPFDEPFPLGGTCGPNPSTLLPMRSTCVMCHEATGALLIGTLSHGPQELRVDRDSDLQVRVSIDAKKTRSDFVTLRALFHAADVSTGL